MRDTKKLNNSKIEGENLFAIIDVVVKLFVNLEH